MKKIVESIHIMNKLAREIGYRVELIVDFKFTSRPLQSLSDKDLSLLNSLFYMALIDSISYLDEYKEVFGVKTERIFKERIIVVKAINKPFMSKINEWKDLKNLRNHLLAHNLRIGKNGEFMFNNENLDYKSPRTLNDLFLLHNLISFSAQTFNSEFSEEIKSFGKLNVAEIINTGKKLTKDDVSQITLELINEATKIKVQKERDYDFTVNNTIDWNEV